MQSNDCDVPIYYARPLQRSSSFTYRLLPDIERGVTWSEEYRMHCEARMLIAWPRYRRQEYYERIQKRRGQGYASLLISAVRLAYEESQQ